MPSKRLMSVASAIAPEDFNIFDIACSLVTGHASQSSKLTGNQYFDRDNQRQKAPNHTPPARSFAAITT